MGETDLPEFSSDELEKQINSLQGLIDDDVLDGDELAIANNKIASMRLEIDERNEKERKAEEAKQAAKRMAAKKQKQDDAEKIAGEIARLEEETRRLEAEKTNADERRLAAEREADERQKKKDAEREAEDERSAEQERKIAEAQRTADEAKKALAEAEKKAEKLPLAEKGEDVEKTDEVEPAMASSTAPSLAIIKGIKGAIKRKQ